MSLSSLVPDAYSFMSVSQEIVTLEGESVTIQCEVANLGELVSVHVFTLCSREHSALVYPAAIFLVSNYSELVKKTNDIVLNNYILLT